MRENGAGRRRTKSDDFCVFKNCLQSYWCCVHEGPYLKTALLLSERSYAVLKKRITVFFSRTLCNHIGADFPNDDISRLHSSF